MQPQPSRRRISPRRLAALASVGALTLAVCSSAGNGHLYNRLYQATGEKKWLTAADEITAKQIELFADDAGGGFFFTSKDHEALFARAKDPVDSAVPAGNSVAASNLIFLAVELNKPELLERATARA